MGRTARRVPVGPAPRRVAAILAILAITTIGLASCGAQSVHAIGSHTPRSSPKPPTGSLCTYFAAPASYPGATGRGTFKRPYRGFQRLVDVLRPGDTGCLLAGNYIEDPDITRGGTAAEPVAIRDVPGQTAELDGNLSIERGAGYVTVEFLKICGAAGAPGCAADSFSSGRDTAIDISADHSVVRFDDISNPTGVCVLMGTAPASDGEAGPANEADIAFNRIHNCGGTPGSSSTIEGLYLAHSSDSVVSHNKIYDNASMGIQFYPDAQHDVFSYNQVWDNGGGVSFGGTGAFRSSYNLVEHNLIENSIGRWNVSSYWPNGAGVGNVVSHNCLKASSSQQYYSANGGIQPSRLGAAGFRSYDNATCSGTTG